MNVYETAMLDIASAHLTEILQVSADGDLQTAADLHRGLLALKKSGNDNKLRRMLRERLSAWALTPASIKTRASCGRFTHPSYPGDMFKSCPFCELEGLPE